jgi:hypothetical protein
MRLSCGRKRTNMFIKERGGEKRFFFSHREGHSIFLGKEK